MRIMGNDNAIHHSFINLIKKGYDVLKRFFTRKPIELDDDGAIPVASDTDILDIFDGNMLIIIKVKAIIISKYKCVTYFEFS